MTNYFSRLARTTGLHFGAAHTPRAAPEHEASPARLPLDAAAGEPPLHVEELRFVEPEPAPASAPALAAPFEPPPPAGLTHLNAPAQAPTREESHAVVRVQPPAGPSIFVDERPLPGERAADSRPPVFLEEPRVELVPEKEEEEYAARPFETRERTVTQTDAPPTHGEPSPRQTRSVQESPPPQPARPTEMTAADPAREDAGREGLIALELSEVVQLPEPPAPTLDAEPAASPAAQAEARRAYLREVVEWITGPTDPAPELDSSISIGAVESESFGPAESKARESKASRPAAVVLRERAEASSELEVQDFSLSIGSISIVVEDAPKPAPAAAPPAPAHRPESDERRPAPVETSRLRRHYIRGL